MLELKHEKYKILCVPGKIYVTLGDKPISKYYKVNDNVTIGMDSDMDTVTIELKHNDEPKKETKPIEVVLKHKNVRAGKAK